MDIQLAGDTTANTDKDQATQVVTRDLMKLDGYPADKLGADEQLQAKERFAFIVSARLCERRLERLTLDRVILEMGGQPKTWTGSFADLVREQLTQTRLLIGVLESIRTKWIHRPDDMYVRLPTYDGQISQLNGLLTPQ